MTTGSFMTKIAKDKHTIGVLGVRDFRGTLYKNDDYVTDIMDMHVQRLGTTYDKVAVVTGGGKGVEQMVIEWCKTVSIDVTTIPPNRRELGDQKAFAERNVNVLSASQELIIFWDGYIDNLIQIVRTAMFQQKPVHVIPLM
jgi:hypothetical protein